MDVSGLLHLSCSGQFQPVTSDSHVHSEAENHSLV
jgi:hypothetical protein